MTNELRPTGNDGDIVHNHQTMASKQGHSCVSELWYQKTMSIDDGIEKINNAKRQREDIECPVKDMQWRLNDEKQLVLEYIDGREFLPTEHALRQAATWCGGLSHAFVKQMTNPVLKQNGKVDYNRDEGDAETLLRAFLNGFRRIERDKKFRFRTYKDGTLRAWLSDRYSPIDNVWYLEQIKNLLGDNARLSHWRGNADTIYGNILIPDTVRKANDSDYGGMISPGNCEVGIRRFEQYPSVFRAICMNGCIWDQSKGNIISQVHKGNIDLTKLRVKIFDNINKQIPLMGVAVDNFLAKQQLKVSDADSLVAILAQVAKDNSMTKKQSRKVVEQFNKFESESRNLFGIINAVTRAGQEFENEDWLKYDMAAGKMMNWDANQWERHKNKAKNLVKEDIEKVFGCSI